jgi:malonyl-CoA O-methyltransferase
VDEKPRPALSRAHIARLFAGRSESGFMVREVAARMAERLDLMRIEPTVVIDVGSGAGADLVRLSQRYPKASVLGLDLATTATRAPSSIGSRLKRLLLAPSGPLLVQSDAVQTPLKPAFADLIWSNCALHWISDPEAAIAEWSRLLKPEAALLFSCFGPDSLEQVRSAFAEVDDLAHTVAFTDLHDYGDMLASHGFAQPVMDAERVTLTYDHATAFWSDVRELGGNPLVERRRGLLGRAAALRLEAALEAQRNSHGKLELTFEIIYGHAWKGVPKVRSDGLSVVAMPKRAR